MFAPSPARLWLRAAAAATLAVCVLWPPPAARGALPLPEDALPRLETADLFQPGEPAVLYADGGEPFAVLGDFRVFVPLARIPKTLRDAVVAVEDARFFQHGAVDLQGMARAALRNLTAGRITEGGSTITQQLAKTLFLTNERTLSRKMKEVQLARELERRYSKEKILEMYLNAVYFGDGAYGVEAAARTFFSKGVADLTLAEAALLAGLPKAPSRSSPIAYPQRAKARRDHVLARMAEAKMLSPARARAAQREPVRTKPFLAARGIAPHFADHVQKQLEAELGPAAVARGGLRVSTTLNLRLQRAATEALRNGVRAAQASGASGAAKARGKGGKAAPGIEGAGGDGLEGALVALDPRSGEIQAMVGGLNYGRSQFNRAVQSRRQPGSAFKPFVYAAALEAGLPLTTRLDDVPVTYPAGWGRRHGTWSPENYDRRFRGRVTMREALEESINVPTVRLLDTVGVDTVLDVASRMGIAGPLRRDLTLALGTSEVTLLELASAYAVIANRGLRVPPTAVRQVAGAGGEVRPGRRPETERVLSEEVAFLLTSLLQGVIERGTGRRAQALGRPAAGKTGTSQDATDLWFVGFTPSLVGGVWVGYDAPRSLGSHETGGRAAVPIWTDFMARALRGTEPIPFQQPDGIYTALVNRRTGEAAPPGEADGFAEFFVRGRGPALIPSGIPRPASVSSPVVPAPAGPAYDVIPPWGARP
ncbi:MAG TPA: PBP1A family penicillin-binding protein [Candidatus Methylomirabilis sp.]|jgi:penicillin-binding protein 1A